MKGEVERVHNDIFPEIGFLTIHAVKVKQNSNFYRLPDSICLKQACLGNGNFWCLHADASLTTKLEKTSSSSSLPFSTGASDSHFNKCKKLRKFSGKRIKKCSLRRTWCLRAVLQGLVATTCLLRQKKGRGARHKVRKVPTESYAESLEQDSPCRQGFEEKAIYKQEVLCSVQEPQVAGFDGTAETPCESFSGAISVSCIIDKYFTHLTDTDQVTSALSSEVAWGTREDISEARHYGKSCYCEPHSRKQESMQKTRLLLHSLPDELSSVAVRKYKRSELGERFVTASNSLGPCQSSQRSSLSKGKRLFNPDSGSIVRNLVFEIDGNG